MVLFIYLLAALGVGFWGRHKSIGFVGYFILSLLITPVVAFGILLIGADHPGFIKEKKRDQSYRETV
jgi:hypothetical protein